MQQAEVLAFNDIIRNGVPARSAVFGTARLELIRSKDFAKWCRENAEVVRSSGLLKDADVDVEKMTKALAELLKVDLDEWRTELGLIEEHYDSIGDRLPAEMRNQLGRLADRLNA